MSRLPNLTDRLQLPEELRDAYDRVAGLRQGAVSGPYGVLLHSPELAERAASLSNYLRWNSALTPFQTELAVLATARELEAKVMWASHVRLGREAGVSDGTIDVIANGADLGSLPDEETAIIRYVRELLGSHRVSQAAFDDLQTRLGNQSVVDLAGLVGYYSFVGTVLNTFEIEPPAGSPELPSG